MAAETNTEKIAKLENRVASLSARLDVFDNVLDKIDELLKKCSAATEGQGTKITVIEQQVLVIADLKAAMTVIASIKEELVAIKKDIESFHSWKAEQKKEKEEATRRWWAFGPNITAALIGGFITILGIVLNIALTYYLNRPK